MLDAASLSHRRDALIGWGKGLGPERIIWAVRVVALLLCVAMLAAGLLRVVSVWREHAASAGRVVAQADRQAPEDAAAVDAETVKRWGWYSDPAAAGFGNAAAPVAQEQAVKTSLQLQLEGIIKADEPAASVAIITIDNKSQRYKTGAKLPVATGVYLREILWDRIILENNGRREELPLFTSQLLSRHAVDLDAGAAAASSALIDHSGDAALTGMLGRYRQELLRDPNAVSRFLDFSPSVRDGALQGYAIRATGRRQDFGSLGLQDGDVVTHVNGVELTDMRQAMELYRGMGELENVRIQLIRRGQVQEILYRLPPPR